ncbi:MAG: hypothetical protein KTR31_31300 [Myxococcales bacterium]|nr:hypothetical protein [Myxococcales bacterium]
MVRVGWIAMVLAGCTAAKDLRRVVGTTVQATPDVPTGPHPAVAVPEATPRRAVVVVEVVNDPTAMVSVTVRERRRSCDDSPCVFKLPQGQHVLTITPTGHAGGVPADRLTVSMAAGEQVLVRHLVAEFRDTEVRPADGPDTGRGVLPFVVEGLGWGIIGTMAMVATGVGPSRTGHRELAMPVALGVGAGTSLVLTGYSIRRPALVERSVQPSNTTVMRYMPPASGGSDE